MLEPHQLHDYQKTAVDFQCTRPASAMWLDMGLGKTIITLTSIARMQTMGMIGSVLIVAPVRVIRMVWRQEALKWSHTKSMTFSLVAGTPSQRLCALGRQANVYLINYENMKWLAEVLETRFLKKGLPLPFNGLVWDELSKMKNSQSQRVKAFFDNRRKYNLLEEFKWRTGLTGTPASNGYKDLFGQYLVLDSGERLGTSKTKFESYFYYSIPDTFKSSAYPDTEERIKELVGDITLEMSAEDYNPLPDMIVNNVEVELPKDARAAYDELESKFFVELKNGESVEAFNTAALMNKLFQFSNGAVYPVSGLPVWSKVHDAKLDALEEIIEEANGKPVLCAYAYRSDAERIMERFKDIDPINLTVCKSQQSLDNAMNRWKNDDCRLMIGHPASMGHGVDGLQKNGNILVWYGLTWSLDLYEQFNARIRRQGQGMPVMCHQIVSASTLDQVQMQALSDKATDQQSLRRAIKQYAEEKTS